MKFNQVTKAIPIYNAIGVFRRDIKGLKEIENKLIIRLNFETNPGRLELNNFSESESILIVQSILVEKESQLKHAIKELENI